MGYSCLCPVLTGPEASATMSFFLSVWRNVHGAHSFSEGWLWKKLALGEITCGKMSAIPTPGSRPSAKCPCQDLAEKKWPAEIIGTSPL